jgi:CheY-like chemotaxis protein
MRKVLIADDDRFVRELLHATLSPHFKVTAVCNGDEVIAELSRRSYDLLLLDLNMPVCDGWQTIVRLRHELDVWIPIVAVSAYILPGDRVRATNAGCCSFVSKPICVPDLMEAVHTALTESTP